MSEKASVRVKICGITSVADAQVSLDAGADFIGLIFAPQSPRRLDIDTARKIAQTIQGSTQVVGVFQNQSAAEIKAIAEQVALDFIQLHGDEPPSLAGVLPLPVIRFAPLRECPLNQRRTTQPVSPTPQAVLPFRADSLESAVALLLEPDKASGVGLARWLEESPDEEEILRNLSRTTPLFLAGKLTPDNVAAVLERIRPFALDVASGVESRPGVKNPAHVRRFCETIKACHSDFAGSSSLCNPLDFSGLSGAFTFPNR